MRLTPGEFYFTYLTIHGLYPRVTQPQSVSYFQIRFIVGSVVCAVAGAIISLLQSRLREKDSFGFLHHTGELTGPQGLGGTLETGSNLCQRLNGQALKQIFKIL